MSFKRNSKYKVQTNVRKTLFIYIFYFLQYVLFFALFPQHFQYSDVTWGFAAMDIDPISQENFNARPFYFLGRGCGYDTNLIFS